MSNRGTACTVGQLGEIAGNIIRALPNALRLLEAQGTLFPKWVVKYSQEGERLSCAIAVVFKMMYDGNADIAALMNGHYINCDADPFIPTGWSVEEHQKGGQFQWDAAKVKLWLANGQKCGKWMHGNKLCKEMKDKPVLNACVLDYLLANPHLIPGEWKGKYVFFWNTLYRNNDINLCVRFLYWDAGGWSWSRSLVGGDWGDGNPAALRTS